jgi:hypothetical protein
VCLLHLLPANSGSGELPSNVSPECQGIRLGQSRDSVANQLHSDVRRPLYMHSQGPTSACTAGVGLTCMYQIQRSSRPSKPQRCLTSSTNRRAAIRIATALPIFLPIFLPISASLHVSVAAADVLHMLMFRSFRKSCDLETIV